MTPGDPTPPRPSKGQGDERRAHPRAAVDWPVTIALQDGEHEARLRDVSKAGVCFYLDRRVPEMTMLRLELDVPAPAATVASGDDGPDEVRISRNGVVVRCRALAPSLEHYEVAVFLNDMTEEDRERLADFVSSAEAAAG